jgi:hypothetical protein
MKRSASPAVEGEPWSIDSNSFAYRLMSAALFLLIGLVALLPRALDLGAFLDSDEVNFWIGRSHEFLQAIQSGQFADTAISTHPGVTTMWLGSAGIVLRRSLLEWGLLHDIPFPTYLALMRLPVVLAHTAGVLAGYALLRRMLPLGVATLAALLWAADPFVIAYQRILHVDGLTTTFATLSMLAACAHWHHQRHMALLVLSAVCGALAVLSKSPGLAVLPIVAGMALWADWRAPLAALRSLVVWGGVFALTLVIVWPAVWADPLRVYELLRIGVEIEGGNPHVIGNFFLGQATETPGPLFYPAALALRTTPLTLPGLLLLPLVWQRNPDDAPTRRDLAVLAAFVILFVLALSLFPKKLNRYSVPTFPVLDILAAVSLMWGVQRGAQMLKAGRQVARMWWGVAGVVGALAVLNAVWWHPYFVVAFNQALGGAPTGARTFLLGDGEGMREAADWLHQQSNITGVTVASTMINSFQPFLRHGEQAVAPDEQLSDEVGYVVVYLRHTQRGPLREPFSHFYPAAQPVHTVTIHGVEYAWIYEVPPPVANSVEATFGADIRLSGYEVDTTALRSTGMLSLTVQWQALAPPEQNYLMFVHVLDSSGQTVGQTDAPPAGPAVPTSAWEEERYYTWVHPVPVPADLPPGDYWLSIGLYEPDTFARLPLRRASAAPPGMPDDGEHALLLPLRVGGP